VRITKIYLSLPIINNLCKAGDWQHNQRQRLQNLEWTKLHTNSFKPLYFYSSSLTDFKPILMLYYLTQQYSI
jgi:hypothetical protein